MNTKDVEIDRLKQYIENDAFCDWCDSFIQCKSDCRYGTGSYSRLTIDVARGYLDGTLPAKRQESNV